MFSNLRQGQTVYILDQLKIKKGVIVENKPNYTGTMDMKVKTDDQEYELSKLPYNQSVANNGSLVISENLDSILNEVRKLKADADEKVNNYDYYKETSESCAAILRQYDSSYNKEYERDKEIENLKQQNEELKQQIGTMAQSLSNIEKLLSNKNQ